MNITFNTNINESVKLQISWYDSNYKTTHSLTEIHMFDIASRRILVNRKMLLNREVFLEILVTYCSEEP